MTRVGLEPSTFQFQVASFTPRPLMLVGKIEFLISRTEGWYYCIGGHNFFFWGEKGLITFFAVKKRWKPIVMTLKGEKCLKLFLKGGGGRKLFLYIQITVNQAPPPKKVKNLIYQNISKFFKILQNLSKSFKIYQNLSKFIKMYQNLSKSFKN